MRRLGKRRAISAAYQVYCGKKLVGTYYSLAKAKSKAPSGKWTAGRMGYMGPENYSIKVTVRG